MRGAIGENSEVPVPRLVFLLDVDNTLLDNDAVKRDLGTAVERELGTEIAGRFWQYYESVRADLHRVDFPEVLRRLKEGGVPAPAAERISALVNAIPFEKYRYPEALATLDHLAHLGTTVILSDGDPVFQAEKISRAGFAAAVGSRVLITTHKEAEIQTVLARFPADCYVMIDDKPALLATIKRQRPDTFRTILVAQGHYALEEDTGDPPPDLIVKHIGDLLTLGLSQLDGSGGRDGR